MIGQDHPRFEQHMRFLVDSVIKIKGTTEYAMRMEQWDLATATDPTHSHRGSEWVTCANCGQRVSVKDECKETKSKYVEYLDNVSFTKCCGKSTDFKKLCPFVCIPCRRIALFLTPHTNDGGFRYAPGRTYHIDACPECDGRDSELTGHKSSILEQVVHNKINNLKSEG